MQRAGHEHPVAAGARARARPRPAGRWAARSRPTCSTARPTTSRAGGPVAELLGPLEHDPPGSVPALRFAGALHRLVLERRAPALAVHYPSVGGTPGDVWPAARAVVEEHLDDAARAGPPAGADQRGRPQQRAARRAAARRRGDRPAGAPAGGRRQRRAEPARRPLPARGRRRRRARRPRARPSCSTRPGRGGCRRSRAPLRARRAARLRPRAARPVERRGPPDAHVVRLGRPGRPLRAPARRAAGRRRRARRRSSALPRQRLPRARAAPAGRASSPSSGTRWCGSTSTRTSARAIDALLAEAPGAGPTDGGAARAPVARARARSSADALPAVALHDLAGRRAARCWPTCTGHGPPVAWR